MINENKIQSTKATYNEMDMIPMLNRYATRTDS